MHAAHSQEFRKLGLAVVISTSGPACCERLGGGEEVTGLPMGDGSLTCEFGNLGGKTLRRSRGWGRSSAPNLLPRNANGLPIKIIEAV